MGEDFIFDKKASTLFIEERLAKTKALLEEDGHPLQLFAKENEALKLKMKSAKEALQSGNADKKFLNEIRDLSIHYAKKGDLLYPLLKVKYGVAGPSDLMWTSDDDIRDELAALAKADVIDDGWQKRFEAVLVAMDEMLYKEEKVLFPNCAGYFTEEEWIGIYYDGQDYDECFGVKATVWEKAKEKKKSVEPYIKEQEVFMAGGHMTAEQLTALFNTMPFEITFVDADNINRFFNEGPKDFKRPQMAIGREVFSCHPPKIEAKVRKIIEEFRAGTLDEIPIWMEKNGKCLLVKYMAVRDKDNNYIGTVEIVQDMDFAKEHFLPQRKILG